MQVCHSLFCRFKTMQYLDIICSNQKFLGNCPFDSSKNGALYLLYTAAAAALSASLTFNVISKYAFVMIFSFKSVYQSSEISTGEALFAINRITMRAMMRKGMTAIFTPCQPQYLRIHPAEKLDALMTVKTRKS